MKREDITQNIIDCYLQNNLSEEDHRAFEGILRHDEELQQEVNLTRLIIAGFNHEGEKAAIEEMKSLSPKAFAAIISNAEKKYEKEEAGEERKRQDIAASGTRYRQIFITIASVAAIALMVVYIGFRPKYSVGDLYYEYYSALEYEPVPNRGSSSFSEEQEIQVTEAFALYEEGDYSGALAKFDGAVAGLPLQQIPDDVVFYSSVCMMQNEQQDKAIDRFKYLAHTGSVFKQDAEWYQALACIKNNDRDAATALLSTISNDRTHIYTLQAKGLLEKLEKKKWF